MSETGRARGAMVFEANDLGRRFEDGTEALADISLTARAGGFVAILGPSGCGKSTLLRILAGLDSATAGRVVWREGPPAKGDIAFVFQEPTLLPWASLWDNVYLPLRLAGRSRAEARPAVDDSIRLVGLDGFAQSRPGQLSGGMKMRASVARALVTGPSLLLMDEPFAALDEITRFRLNDDLLRIWAAQRCTVLFVTHSVFEAVYLAERVIVMSPRPGRIVGEVPIDLPYPRDAALRTEVAYAAQCRRISELLAESAS
jgi:NitT/TauT family transport system ATP-binding protein